MARGSFWDYQDYWSTITSSSSWFDAEWKQRRDLNRVESDAQQLQLDANVQRQALGQMQQQMLELSMTVVVLTQMLQESGHLDVEALHTRLDAELEKLRPVRRAIEAHPTKAPPPDAPVQCAKCGRSVPSTKTTITESGTVCDSCAG
jgi:formylmethanofuran dehydrogenase subunit E